MYYNVRTWGISKIKYTIYKYLLYKKKAELTAIYEKARYSKKECSKEEVKLIKNMLK